MCNWVYIGLSLACILGFLRLVEFGSRNVNAARQFHQSIPSTTLTSRLPTLPHDEQIVPKILAIRNSGNIPVLFIAVNLKNITTRPRPPWLSACQPPQCMYQLFTDTDEPGCVKYPVGAFESDYLSFGYRGRFQMGWALGKSDAWTHFLRVDEDGFLCVKALLNDMYDVQHLKLFVWGRFWCNNYKKIRYLQGHVFD